MDCECEEEKSAIEIKTEPDILIIKEEDPLNEITKEDVKLFPEIQEGLIKKEEISDSDGDNKSDAELFTITKQDNDSDGSNYEDELIEPMQVAKNHDAPSLSQFKKFICKNCPCLNPKQYLNLKDLVKHIQDEHYFEFPYEHLMTKIQKCFEQANDICMVDYDKIRITKYRSLHCVFCPKMKFTTNKIFRKHIMTKHNDHEFKCPDCRETFMRHSKKLQHIFTNHYPEKKKRLLHACDHCPKVYDTARQLKRHQKIERTPKKKPEDTPIVEERRHECTFCISKFRSRADLRVHLETHKTATNCSCEICGKTFTTKKKMFYHMRTAHGEPRFKCEQCPKMFHYTGALKVHKKVHEDKWDFICEICSRGFKLKQQLEFHLISHKNSIKTRIKNNPNNPFKCNLCTCSYKQQYHLSYHKRVKHGAAGPGKYPQKKEESNKTHDCQICGHKFTSGMGLYNHMRLTKTLHKRIECKLCSVFIYGQNIFDEHMATVHSEKSEATST